MTAPFIVDVDTGIDDSLALLYACASPEVELVAVTCVSGNVGLELVQENTRAVLELAGRDDVEVAAGRPVPLIRPLVTASETHGPRGLGYAELPTPRRPLSDRHAVDLLVDEVRRRPGEVTLVAVGPLTNVALAVLREPDLPRLVRRLVIMGGAFRTPGNTTPTSEWNIHVDPEAAGIVFRSFGSDDAPRPLVLGLDVTERLKFTTDHMVRLAHRSSSRPLPELDAEQRLSARSVASHRVVRFVADALRFYMEFHARYDGFYGAFIHDPLAMAAAIDPSLVRAEAVAVDVELAGTLTTGETVADWRHAWARPPNADVVVEARTADFLDRFVERVGDLAARIGE